MAAAYGKAPTYVANNGFNRLFMIGNSNEAPFVRTRVNFFNNGDPTAGGPVISARFVQISDTEKRWLQLHKIQMPVYIVQRSIQSKM